MTFGRPGGLIRVRPTRRRRDEREDELRTRHPELGRPRHARPRCRRRLLRAAVRVELRPRREPRGDRRIPLGDAARAAGRRGDEADAGGAAASLVDLHLGRGRRRHGCGGQGQRRQRRGRADRRARHRPHGLLRRPDRGVLRHLAAEDLPRGRLVNEPGAFAWNELETARPRRRESLLRRRLRLGVRRPRHGADGHLHGVEAGGQHGRRDGEHHRPRPRRGPGPLDRLLRGRGRRRLGRPDRRARRRRPLRPGRHPGRPLRDGRRPVGRPLRRDQARRRG